MYLDLTIKIEWDKLPKCLQTDFRTLKEYYDKNDVALFSSEKYVSRGEFVKYIIKLLQFILRML